LHTPATRALVRDETERGMVQSWSDITISGVAGAANAGLVGRTIADIAAERGASGVDTALDLLAEENAAVNVVSFNQSESNLRQLLSHPLCTVISDGFYVNGRPHPRLHGTFPELLGSVVRDRRWMSLPEAIHKVTGKPAARLRLENRGMLREGFAADITVFDPQTVRSRATYEAPDLPPEGILYVIRDGQFSIG
jgi:N-acyl-D-amino-acid deacylase